jgi:glutaminyl-tRNA synthetase
MLDHSIRELLNKTAPRRMAVLRPLKLVIENYSDGGGEMLEAVNNPEDQAAGTRHIPFARELYIERDDFAEHPPPKFYRLSPGREVRLRYAYFVRCREVKKDAAGEVVGLICTYDPQTRGGNAPDGRRVQGTLHWVAAAHAVPAEIRLYNPLFSCVEPGLGGDLSSELNPTSLETMAEGRVEPTLAAAIPGEPVQFERQGYFCVDPDSTPARLIFNRTVGLRDSWAKIRGGG